MPFVFKHLEGIPGVVLIEPRVLTDPRGWFMEAFKRSDFAAAGLPTEFVQQNQSQSQPGTLRGLHFQRQPKSQGKLVRVLAGEIFDVAVDIRAGSPSCGNAVGVTLSAANRQMLYVPPWCAHGFYVTSAESAEVLYLTTDEYSKPHEGGFLWNDPAFGIQWPFSGAGAGPGFLSDRDRDWPPFSPLSWDL